MSTIYTVFWKNWSKGIKRGSRWKA
jgi:hypothetical protein